MKNRLTRYNNGYIGNEDSTKSISDGIVGLNKKNTFFGENFNTNDPDGGKYSPPSEWVSLPSFDGLTQYFAGVFAVYDSDSNFVTLQMNTSTGNYTVDWGDGTTGSFADNAIAYKQYTTAGYSGLTSTVFRGYKTVLITAWPQSGTIIELKLSNQHNQSGLQTEYTRAWLNVKLVGSSCSNFDFGTRLRMLEQIDFIGANAQTSNNARFASLVSLKKLVNWSTQNSTSFRDMFSYCYSLREIPPLDCSKVTDIIGMFRFCVSIPYIPWMDTSNITSLYETFWSCLSLKTLPPLNLSKCTDGFRAIEGSFSLEEIPWMDTSKMNQLSFSNCYRLKKIPNLNTSNMTSFAYMFTNCVSLKEVPTLDTSKGTNFIQMFSGCNSLEKVQDIIDLRAVTNGSNVNGMFYECRSLKKAPTFLRPNNIYMDLGLLYWRCFSLKELPNDNYTRISSFWQAYNETSNMNNFGNTFFFPAGQTWAGSNVFQNTFAYSGVRRIGISDVSGISGSTYVNSYNNMFVSASSLIECGLSGISENFSIQNCSLGPTALNDLYTRLGVVGASGAAAKTITVSGNWGTANDNPSIAIAKGWQVSG